MERIMTHVGGSSGGSVVSREEEEEGQQSSNSNIGVLLDEVCSYQDEADLQLGLGLSLGVGASVGNKQQGPRILTPKDLPCMGLRTLKASPPSAASSSSSCLGGGVDGGNYQGSCASGTKKPADTSPTGVSQVVGWPPVRAYRVNILANQAKTVTAGEAHPNKGDGVICNTEDKGEAKHKDSEHLRALFVKVNMDGIGIGRKVDLNAHSSYDSLAQTLEEMFTLPNRSDTFPSNRGECGGIQKAKRSSRLLDGLLDFVLTYEDKDGDWMLVGDVPWGLFLNSVKRLRIMKRSEANGLESSFEERTSKPRSDPCAQRSRLI